MNSGKQIGVTGHQEREGLDWHWTRSQIAVVLRDESPVGGALTSLAIGTDQLFAQEALLQRIVVTAVIPFEDYERSFKGAGLESYRGLLAQCGHILVLESRDSDEKAFLAAGIRVADGSDLLVAVWDGKPAEGLGGTADIVSYALKHGREIVHLDPFSRTVRRLRP